MWLWQVCTQWVGKVAAGWYLGSCLVVSDWSVCSDIGKEEWGDVKGLLVTKSTDLGYWFGAESKEKGRL